MFILHLKSVFLTVISLFLIAFSITVTILITEGILGSTYFGQMHLIIIFVVVGISADDIFVFIDAWR